MIIKEVYIENFGGIKDRRYQWNDGLNIIYAPNESGKTTTAEFIHAMLYGMNSKVRDKRANSRKRYTPLDGSRMSGEMVVGYEGRDITIRRTFGTTKAGDTVSVTDAVTGKEIPGLMCDTPGNTLCNMGEKSFISSMYIRQLEAKIQAEDSDEILSKLMNLAQSGDEDISYRNAIKILDSQIREINGSRGKIQEIKNKIADTYDKKADAGHNMQRLEEYKNMVENLTAESEKLKSTKSTAGEVQRLREMLKNAKSTKSSPILLTIGVAALLLAVTMFFIRPEFCIIPFIMAIVAFGVQIFKKRSLSDETELLEILGVDNLAQAEEKLRELEESSENQEQLRMKRLMDISCQIGEINSRISAVEIVPDNVFNEEIRKLEKEIENYNDIVHDIYFAKDCMERAFDELQQSFGIRLNEETSAILCQISNGKYTQSLIDESFNLTLKEHNGNIIDGAYLSVGAYDMVYFALRFAIANLLFSDTPMILDDAFAAYDDSRTKASVEYLKSVNRQILLFTCHNRERDFVKSS